MNPKFADLSFDAVLPSAILFNENIEPNAIKLYAFVRGLSRLEGYCFATNSYLAECMSCDESTVKRLLNSLKQEKFIEIETDKETIHWQRKIYISTDFKKCLRRLKNEPPPAQNQAPPSSKSSPPIYKEYKGYSIEDRKEGEESQSSSPRAHQKKPKEEKMQVVDRVYITKSQHESLLKKANGSDELVKKWYIHLSEWKIGKGIDYRPNDYKAINDWVIGAVEEKYQKSPKNDSKASNLVQRIEKVISVKKIQSVQIYPDRIEYKYPGRELFDTFFLDDKNFKNHMIHIFRKMNAPVNVLDYLEGKTEDL